MTATPEIAEEIGPPSGLTDIHAHPAMNAYFWDRNLRRHYFAGPWWNPLASLTDFPMLERGGVKVLWSSLHVPEPEFLRFFLLRFAASLTRGGRSLLRLNAWDALVEMWSTMEAQTTNSPEGRFQIARSNAELDRILADDRSAIIHTVEGGHVLGAGLDYADLDGRLARLDDLAERGIASLTLAHLFPNELAGHAEAIPSFFRRIAGFDTGVVLKRGLTDTGRAVLERMVELRIVPDIAHCTPRARAEIYEQVSNRIPIVATHVGMRSINPEAYNLDESDVRAIATSGGVVGVIFMPHWLDQRDPKNGLPAIWQTMSAIRDACDGSWKHVAIGTDFDGFTDPPDDCYSPAQLPKIQNMLEVERLDREEVNAVLGGNARRVLREGWR